MPELRIFLVDDHAIVREGLKALITAQEGLTVVGEADDGIDACERVPGLRADQADCPDCLLPVHR